MARKASSSAAETMQTPAPTSGLGIGPASREAGNALPSRPVPRARIAPEGSKSLSADAEGAAQSAPKLGLSPQEVLGSKRVYTLAREYAESDQRVRQLGPEFCGAE